MYDCDNLNYCNNGCFLERSVNIWFVIWICDFGFVYGGGFFLGGGYVGRIIYFYLLVFLWKCLLNVIYMLSDIIGCMFK